jgi:flagellar hook-associated protein 2
MSTTSSTSATTTPASNSALLQLSGLASGINWSSLVQQLGQAESAPETGMQAQEAAYQAQKTAYQTIGTDLTTLSDDITTLTGANFFSTRTATSSDTSVASATADAGTGAGSYTFNITQMATAAAMQGATVAVNPLSATNDVSSLTLANATFANPITAGTFTVNGQIVTIATSDTLQSVFDKISTATGGAVTGSYNASTDEITLSSGSPIVLGSATDTSNFLQAAELYNNGTGTVTSTSALGTVNLTGDLSSSNLTTPITDGGSGNGEFMINGVAINFDASTDSIDDILAKIDNSGAGVTATYDSLNKQFALTDNTPGDVGISMQDVTGNFLAATGLSAGTLQRGTNLQYNVNGGGTLTSQSNTITSATSGITGLSVTALGTGSTTVSVGADTTTISNAITKFVNDYNAVQNYISSQTATSTDSSGDVTPGTLTGDLNVEDITLTLRQMIDASSGSGAVQNLNDLGIASNGNDNTLAIADPSTITSALTNNLSAVQSLFTDPTSGLATTMSTYISDLTGLTGVLTSGETNFTNESNNVAQSLTALQQKVSNDETNMTNEFVAMETAINTVNQQKQYLNEFFSTPSTATNSQTSSASGI